MFLGKTALAGGARWLDRWCDSRVAKFSGHTSQGTMKVTAIFALFGHSIDAGRGTAFPRLSPARRSRLLWNRWQIRPQVKPLRRRDLAQPLDDVRRGPGIDAREQRLELLAAARRVDAEPTLVRARSGRAPSPGTRASATRSSRR